MTDGRRPFKLWGFAAAVLIALALVSATALTGVENSLTARLVGCILATVSLLLGGGCLGLAVRGLISSGLTGIGSRLQKQTGELNIAQERRHADLISRIASVDEQSQAAAREIGEELRTISAALGDLTTAENETAKALGSLARFHRLQTEQMAAIRKQTRAGMEGIDRVYALTSAIQDTAVEGRDSTRKLLNVVRGEVKRSREEADRFASELRGVTGKLDEVEAGQRRTLNFLRREGSIQVVLDRLQASERRLLHSVEGSALTIAEELTVSGGRQCSELRDEIRFAVEEIQGVRAVVGTIQQEIDGSTPRASELLATVGGITHSIGALITSVGEQGNENRASLGKLKESTTDSINMMDGTLHDVCRMHEEVGTATRSVLDSQNATEQRINLLGVSLDGLQARWNALEITLQEYIVQQSTEGDTSDTKQVEDLVPDVRTLVRLTDVLKNDLKSLHRHVDRAGVDTVRQTEALMQLLPRMGNAARRLPPSGGFAMAPDSLLLLSDLIAEHKPKRILELGSGTSTIWIGSFAASIGSSVISIDHLEEYRARTQQDLEAFGLDALVDLRLAELAPVEVMGETKSWYDVSVLKDLSLIDMVIVDGPPESTGPAPRSPAFPLLRSMLSDQALIVVDDMHRDPEMQMVEGWIEFDPSLHKTTWMAGRTAVLEYRRDRIQEGSGELLPSIGVEHESSGDSTAQSLDHPQR